MRVLSGTLSPINKKRRIACAKRQLLFSQNYKSYEKPVTT